ncbi:MAG: hypothetical protein ACE5MH_09145 [Terriglobia bacterium]
MLSQVLAALDQAMASEQQFMAEFVREDKFWKAAQAQARFEALAAFKKVLLTRKTWDDAPGP